MPLLSHCSLTSHLKVKKSLLRCITGKSERFRRFVPVRGLAPSAHVLVGQCKAKPAIIRHFFATVDKDMDVVRVIQGLGSSPDNGESGSNVGSSGRVREFHVVTVDGVAKELSSHVSHSAFDVELAHKVRLHYELRNIFHLK